MGILYYGDNLEILRNKIQDETIDLCYIDPPFNSKRSYFQIYNDIGGEQDKAQAQAFVDTWQWDTRAIEGHQQIINNFEGRFTRQSIELIKGLELILGKSDLLAYLISMTLRVTEIYRVLKPTGSFYLHCDPTASHYLKVVLDSVFGPENYRNEIIWRRTNPKSHISQNFPTSTDTILRYAKSNKYIYHQPYTDHDPDYVETAYKYTDEKGQYRLLPLLNPNDDRPNLTYEFLGVTRVWRWTRERMQKAYEDGIVVQLKPGAVPQYKKYLHESKGRTVTNLWDDIKPVAGNEAFGYPTQKPEALLERIIKASSNEGDTVLDAYCGCGTTVAVAERLKRNWLGIDITYHSISLILRRMESFGENVMKSIKVDGIPRDIDAAKALATRQDDRVRKEFEKWAVLTYTNNRAVINTKKGADKGIDGVVYFATGPDTTERMVLQVKSGGVNRAAIATLHGDMEREQAQIATLITLEEPTKPMKEEASKAGLYYHPLMGKNYDKIQIVTVQELIEQEKRLELPLSHEVLKTAVKQSGSDSQLKIGF